MHSHLEKHILGDTRPGGNNYIRLLAERMADQVINRGLVNVDAVYGSEVVVYAPELYAGTVDLVGLYKGKLAIMDFKTAKRKRSRAMIDDYFHQLGAYGIAHDEMHGTEIDTGVIFMVTRDCDFEEYIIEGDEFAAYQGRFLDRYEQFLRQ
jgi:genome maintenance exonuclease 1